MSLNKEFTSKSHIKVNMPILERLQRENKLLLTIDCPFSTRISLGNMLLEWDLELEDLIHCTRVFIHLERYLG